MIRTLLHYLPGMDGKVRRMPLRILHASLYGLIALVFCGPLPAAGSDQVRQAAARTGTVSIDFGSVLQGKGVGAQLQQAYRAPWSSFFGATGSDEIVAMALAPDGGIVVAGRTTSGDLPVTTYAYQISYRGNQDAFIAKFSADGATLEFLTYLGATGEDVPLGLAVNPAGLIYVCGYTESRFFPTVGVPLEGGYQNGKDLFVSVLSADGRQLVFSDVIGGAGDDIARSIAVDAIGCILICGSTDSDDFPTRNAYDATGHGDDEAFALSIDASYSSLIFSTYISGARSDAAYAVAADTYRNVYVAGVSESEDFPQTTALSHRGNEDAFVCKFNPYGGLIYAAFVGGQRDEGAFALAVDGSGRAHIAGATSSTDFPTSSGAPFPAHSDSENRIAFLARLAANGSTVEFASYLGGTGRDSAYAVAVNAGGIIAVAGITSSTDFPVTADAPYTQAMDSTDAFISLIDPAANEVVMSGYAGGAGMDAATAVGLDDDNNIWLGGRTASVDFPTSAAAAMPDYRGGEIDGFVMYLEAYNKVLLPLRTESTLDFDSVDIGTFRELALTIFNDNSEALELELEITDDPMGQYSLLDASRQSIGANAGIELTIRFRPQAPLPAQAVLSIANAAGDLSVGLSGIGREAAPEPNGFSRVRIPALSARVSQQFEMPLILDSLSADFPVASVSGFRATLAFNSTMLAPVDAALRGRVQDGLHVLTVEAAYNGAQSGDVLGVIRMVAGLGDMPGTVLGLLSFEWLDDTGAVVEGIEVVTVSGSFETVGIWDLGGPRYVNPTGGNLILTIAPNPLYTDGSLRVRHPVDKPATLHIFDASGTMLFDLSERLSTSAEQSVVALQAADFLRGLYFCRLSAGSFSLVRILIVE